MVLVRGLSGSPHSLSSFLSLASPGVQERLRTVWTAEIFEAGPPGLQTNKYHFKIANSAAADLRFQVRSFRVIKQQSREFQYWAKCPGSLPALETKIKTGKL